MSHDVGNNRDCDVDVDHRNNTTQDQDQDSGSQDQDFFFVLEAPRDQDFGLEDYITVRHTSNVWQKGQITLADNGHIELLCHIW